MSWLVGAGKSAVRMVALFAPLVAIALLLMGAGLLADGAARVARMGVAEGRVVSVAVEREEGPGQRAFYAPRVSYVFVVDGVRHVGDRIDRRLEPAFGDRDAAARYLDRYPVGATVAVRYDPADPQRAFLNAWPPMLTPLALALLGGLFWFLGAAARNTVRARAARSAKLSAPPSEAAPELTHLENAS